MPVGLLGYNLGLAMATAALAASVAAVRSPAPAGGTLLARLAAALGLGSVLCLESFLGSELARWAVVGVLALAGEGGRAPAPGRIRRLAVLLGPSALLVAGFVAWKLTAASTYRTNDAAALVAKLAGDPENLIRLPLAMGRDLVNVFCGWFVRFPLWSIRGLGLAAAVGPLLGVAAGGLAFVGLRKELGFGKRAATARAGAPERRDVWRLALPAAALLVIPLAVNSVLVGGISPVGGSDRHAAVVLTGVAAATALATVAWARSARAAAALLSCLVALGVATHHLEGALYARRWEYQRSFWRQLHWRAPALAAGTVVVAVDPGDMFSSRKDMNAIHFAYYPDTPSKRVWGNVYDEHNAAWIADAVRFGRRVRHTSAFGSLDEEADYGGRLLVAYLPDAGATLRLLDRNHLSEVPPASPIPVLALASHSRIEQVDAAGGDSLPGEIFGDEPVRGWAYFFQQAELARQTGAYDELERLRNAVRRQELRPPNPTEWLVFAEGYLRGGRVEEARRALDDLLRSAPAPAGAAVVEAWAAELAGVLPADGEARSVLSRLVSELDEHKDNGAPSDSP